MNIFEKIAKEAFINELNKIAKDNLKADLNIGRSNQGSVKTSREIVGNPSPTSLGKQSVSGTTRSSSKG